MTDLKVTKGTIGLTLLGVVGVAWFLTWVTDSSPSRPPPSAPTVATTPRCGAPSFRAPSATTRLAKGIYARQLLVDGSGVFFSGLGDGAKDSLFNLSDGSKLLRIADNLDQADRMAMDVDTIYWGTSGETLSVPKHHGRPAKFSSWVTALAADSSGVYWATDRELGARLSGQAQNAVLIPNFGASKAIALDPAAVYVGTLGGVTRYDKTSKQARSIAEGEAEIIALDDQDIYASDGGNLRRIDKKGGRETVLFAESPCGRIQDVAVLGGDVYVACYVVRRYLRDTDGSIIAVPKAGGCPVTVAANLNWPKKLAAYDGALYWTDSDGVGRITP